GQAFTLVQKKADGAFEYLYATAGADGNVTFGTIHELSSFMLVKGQLTASGSVSVPNTGDGDSLLPVVLLFFAISVGVAVYRKKRTQA
ncbi:MAG TPA: LPXTG cell wall anchor domain-containing protein, partial [Clostridia bacterium]|nr:LPXTG cell wall anchor domain-containing protein [Clostridia bacterium]